MNAEQLQTAADAEFFGETAVKELHYFYNGEVCVTYDDAEHSYTRYTPDFELVRIDGVTTVTHIIDKSFALMPWAVKKMEEYLLDNWKKRACSWDDECGRFSFIEEDFVKLVAEGKKQHVEIKDDAAGVGKVAHDWIERLINWEISHEGINRCFFPEPMPLESRAQNGCKAALAWMEEHHVKWICTERKVYHRGFNYAGTMDGLAYVDGKLCVVDWKTGNYLYYVEHPMQTAAYEAAQEHELGIDIEDRWIIRLDKYTGEFSSMLREGKYFEQDFKAFTNALALHRSVEGLKAIEKTVKAEARAEKKALKEAAKDKAKVEKAEAKTAAKLEKDAAKEMAKLEKLAAKTKKVVVM